MAMIEPRTYKPLILIGFQSHDPGTVTLANPGGATSGTRQSVRRDAGAERGRDDRSADAHGHRRSAAGR